MKIYNKLVRDKIPEIMTSNGVTPIIKTLNDEEYILSLEKKLDEEVSEYHANKDIEELADVLEVVYALCENSGHSVEELLSICRQKHNDRGGFSEKVFLIAQK